VELNQLANPDLLRLGQELLIPDKDAQPPVETPVPEVATAVPTTAISISEGAEIAVPTPTSSGPPLIEIAQVLGSGVLAEEVVLIRNRGGAVSLDSWTLAGDQGGRFTFPAVVLYPDAAVRIHTRAGSNRPSDLYWGLAEPAWQGGSLITLRDADSEVVDTYIVP
jgi:hypothetical protein